MCVCVFDFKRMLYATRIIFISTFIVNKNMTFEQVGLDRNILLCRLTVKCVKLHK